MSLATGGLREYCGVFGIRSRELSGELAQRTYFGLYALQHRGQESAGIAVSDGSRTLAVRDVGLVSQIFDEGRLAALEPGHIALGHVRYSTTGSASWENAQPEFAGRGETNVAVAHNGNLLGAAALRDALVGEGFEFNSTSDTALVAASVVKGLEDGMDVGEAVLSAMERLSGAYSVAMIAGDALVAFRDPYGFRPLAIGGVEGGYAVSSETCGLDIVGAEYLRDVEPGEVVVIDDEGLHSLRGLSKRRAMCVFEYVYFARPDSNLEGREVAGVRQRMGEILAGEAPAEADVVIPVPDSGIPAAVGYSRASGIPFAEGLIKNRYVGRTFIEPTQKMRQLGIRLKLNPLPSVISGRRVVVIDDSIVRGNTSRKIVELLFQAGAREVHFRVSSPPVTGPCYYGIDMDTPEHLVGANHGVEEIRDQIGATSLAYLSLEGMVAATGRRKESLCRACFDGEYPLAGTAGKFALERQCASLGEK
ncbi:amidophosphoribosyltransferase [Rubrobacter taiwanensis]|jgi:amidophosphoribosyltransferase|uniref:Amidophosphoribosyltransferase n=1 Tax=Rubrobacter taiwanensis TaxID=185139 RepID=A0A4R1BI08_9ACTN|nr:amidophosphoribosyltransferase [Rubrobacter taiwanensis]TCJ16925.1 amidophosphoribosyltransferase [Rubrobacter taiwanensis]